MDRMLLATVFISVISFIGFLGYGLGLMRKSKLELGKHKSPKRKRVSERFRRRLEGDIHDFMSMTTGNNPDDSVSK